ncbi:unnamed protein product [marine sediment metagenome]|uniref:Uncharacterized protein n=1 Tax=marine sediment metagenome TaxID=412755 RepID=X1BXZ5_9ZZZZ
MSEIKVFNMDDYEWYAGRTEQEVIEAFCEYTGMEKGELIQDGFPDELTDAELERLVFFDDIGNQETCEQRSFKQQLKNMIDLDVKFPCFFATSKY